MGYCLSQTGQDDQAQPWYERAVKESEQGDVHGRVDGSLGLSLHQVGYCLSQTGQYEKAQPWWPARVQRSACHGKRAV